MPRMFKSLEEQTLDQRVAVPRGIVPHTNVRGTMRSRMLVTRHFSHSESTAQRLDRHLLLDRRRVLAQIQLAQYGRPDRTKTILALAEPALESPVDARRDEGASGKAEELVESAMQLARPAAQPRRHDMIRLAGQ